MHLFTLTKYFIPKDIIGEFISAIWTERYSSAGDLELVVPATRANQRKLVQGTLIGLRGTKEIMMVETQAVKEGLLTVKGSSLLKFLNEREAWFANPSYDGEDDTNLTVPWTLTTTAGELISDAVYRMVINPTTYGGAWTGQNLDWARDKIPNLTLGKVDNNGATKQLSVQQGPLYDGIQRLAQEEGVGLKLYLESAKYSTQEFSLKFATYRGKNRTSNQEDNLLVRLTPRMDSLSDVEEVSSLEQYKNVIYVNYKNLITTHLVDPTQPIPEGFARRVLRVDAPDLYFNTSDKITAFREQVARNEAANHVYVQAVDGQISGQIGYVFGRDYYLGDIIELEGFTGILTKARISEYIRSQDQYGERDYPTLAVIDPLQTGYFPDVEPDPDELPPGDGDPEIDDDFPPDDPDAPEDPDRDPDGDDDDDGKGDPNPEPDPDPKNGNGDGDPDVILDPHIRFAKGYMYDWFWDPNTLTPIYVPFDPEHPDEWEKPNEDCRPIIVVGQYLEIWGHGFGHLGSKFSGGTAQVHMWSPDRTFNYEGYLDPIIEPGVWAWRGNRLTGYYSLQGPSIWEGVSDAQMEIWLTYEKDGETHESNHVFVAPLTILT
jgi:hypothetical protein